MALAECADDIGDGCAHLASASNMIGAALGDTNPTTITTARTVHRWHIARFGGDNCVLDKRYFLHEYENYVSTCDLDMCLVGVPSSCGPHMAIWGR